MTLADGQVLDKIDIRLSRAGVDHRAASSTSSAIRSPTCMVVPMRYQFVQGRAG